MRTFTLVAFAFAMQCCSQQSNNRSSSPPPSQDGPKTDDGRGLCAGTRFEAQRGGTGDHPIGGGFLEQNGYDFLVIDSNCSYWVQESPSSGVREGVLSRDVAERLSNELKVRQWDAFVGAYSNSLCDGPASRISFGGRIITVTPACGQSQTVDRVAPILQALRAAIEELAAVGAPSDRARYLLVAEGSPEEGGFTTDSSVYRGAPRWPLLVDPSTVSVPFSVADQSPDSAPSQPVNGADAAAVWRIISSYLKGEIGAPASFAPVLDSSGRGYRLFVRGSVPFEDASGAWRIK